MHRVITPKLGIFGFMVSTMLLLFVFGTGAVSFELNTQLPNRALKLSEIEEGQSKFYKNEDGTCEVILFDELEIAQGFPVKINSITYEELEKDHIKVTVLQRDNYDWDTDTDVGLVFKKEIPPSYIIDVVVQELEEDNIYEFTYSR